MANINEVGEEWEVIPASQPGIIPESEPVEEPVEVPVGVPA